MHSPTEDTPEPELEPGEGTTEEKPPTNKKTNNQKNDWSSSRHHQGFQPGDEPTGRE